MPQKVRVGLIGCGAMGLGLAQALTKVPNATIAAVSDLYAEATAQAASKFRAQAYESAEELIGSKELDAVIIATPPADHEALALAAAKAGLHVFCEKPLGLTVDSCKNIIAACKKKKVVLMVGHVLRYFAMPSRVLETISAGRAGDPRTVHITRSGHGWGTDKGWRLEREKCGGLLAEVNIHEIDFMRCLFGDAESVYAVGGNHRTPHMDFEDTLQVVLRFKSGATGTLLTTLASEFNQYKMTLLCTKGTFHSVNFWDQVVFKASGAKETLYEARNFRGSPPFVRELREFVASARDGEAVTIPGEEGLAALAIVEAAEESLRTGKVVSIG